MISENEGSNLGVKEQVPMIVPVDVKDAELLAASQAASLSTNYVQRRLYTRIRS